MRWPVVTGLVAAVGADAGAAGAAGAVVAAPAGAVVAAAGAGAAPPPQPARNAAPGTLPRTSAAPFSIWRRDRRRGVPCSIRVEGRGLPALAGSGMPARARRGERCLLEHVCYILWLPRGQVPHRNQLHLHSRICSAGCTP